MKHTTRKEIKLSRKIVTSNNEAVEVLDDHFSICLSEACCFRQFVAQQTSGNFSVRPPSITWVDDLVVNLSLR